MGGILAPLPDAAEADWIAWANQLETSRLLNVRCTSISVQHATLVLDECPWPSNPNGAIHGGFVAAFADQCLGVMAARVTEAGAYPTTASLTVHYLRPAIAPLEFRAVVDRVGRKLVFVTVTAVDREGDVAATMSGCLSVLRPRATERSDADLDAGDDPTGVG